MSEDPAAHGVGLPSLPSSIDRFRGPRARAWDVTDRADDMDRAGREISHLGVGDPDLDTPGPIVEHAVSALRNGRTHYTPMAGESALTNAIAASATTRYGVSVDEPQVCVFPGAQCAPCLP